MSKLWKSATPYVCLLFIMLLAYLPLSTFIFGMKNDAFSDNFPQKFFLSECIHSGTNPLWNPYLNFGYPTYSDMGFAFYNPIVWLLAAIGYNAYLLTAEVLLYIYIGGIAMYKLGRYFSFTVVIAVAVASMYMCSGFFVGALQHINALAAAAFFPLALLFALRLTEQPCYKNSFLFSLSVYAIFASGHPALPIAFCYYLLVFLVCYLFIQYRLLPKKVLVVVSYFGLSVILVVLFMLPAIYSYTNLLPEYERYVTEIPYNITASTALSSLISLMFPFSTVAHSAFFSNDISFRNFYFSSIGIIFFVFGIKQKKPVIIPLLVSGIFLFFLSLGNPAKMILYDHLPIVKNVRTNGHFRSLLLLSCCCISGFGLQALVQKNVIFNTTWKRLITAIIVLLFLLLFVVGIANDRELFLFFHSLVQSSSVTQKAKSFFELISLPAALFISFFISLFLFVWLRFQQQIKIQTLAVVIILDLIINTIIYVPVTGVGTVTVKQIQSVYNSSPAGIPVPLFIPVNKIDTLSPQMTGLTGSLSYYNKQIGTTSLTDYPSYFTSTERYFNSIDTAIVNRQPYLFFKNDIATCKQNKAGIQVVAFTPSFIKIKVTTPESDTLVYLQNNYKFWHATVNNEPQPIITAYHTFISVGIPAGISTIEFSYVDTTFVWLSFASGVAFLCATSVFVYLKKRKRGLRISQ